jgi:hypothetical protein
VAPPPPQQAAVFKALGFCGGEVLAVNKNMLRNDTLRIGHGGLLRTFGSITGGEFLDYIKATDKGAPLTVVFPSSPLCLSSTCSKRLSLAKVITASSQSCEQNV